MNPRRHLVVSIDDQTLQVMDGETVVHSYQVSTAIKGMGFTPGSHRTPTGRFRIAGKIGAGAPVGTIFKSLQPVGHWQSGDDVESDLILTRILLLDGLDRDNIHSMDRYIYIHGTNQEAGLGRPASHGCIRLGNQPMMDLFEMVEVGTELTILPATRTGGKLWFFDCDSTLSTIEGIDELARAMGPEVFAEVVALTEQAMNGEVAIHEVFPRRMEMIRPNRATCERVAELYMETIVPGVKEWVEELKRDGWTPVILSGGFAPLIRPLATLLGIDHVEAVPLHVMENGTYGGYGTDYPTTRNLGKNEVIRDWKQALLPATVVMMGDGISDMETKPDVDVFIGFGGVVSREKVRLGADGWVTDMTDRLSIRRILSKYGID